MEVNFLCFFVVSKAIQESLESDMAHDWKFRIWDKTLKEFNAKGCTITSNGKILKYNKEVDNLENFSIHFFTGVLDKYDKEIYQEDIVEHTVALGGELTQHVGIILYDSSRGMFVLKDGSSHPLSECFSLRKLGNPYENSVLFDLYVKKLSLS